MQPKRAGLVIAVGLAFTGANLASASPDYPPSAPVIVVSGDLIVGGTAQAAVENCTVGESIRTTLASLPMVESTCEPADSPSATSSSVRGGGVARFDLALPATTGLAAGEARLLESGHTLSFAVDVGAGPAAAADPEPATSSLPAWPFVLLAALIVLVVMVVFARRRTSDDPA